MDLSLLGPCKIPAHSSHPALHVQPCPALAPTGLWALGHHVAAEGDVGRAARLQRDGMRVEVAQHVEDGLEPEVLHVALPALVQRQAQVLQVQGAGGQLGVVRVRPTRAIGRSHLHQPREVCS